jgi:hypothetical protein
MEKIGFPENLIYLHEQEEVLRMNALSYLVNNQEMSLHLDVIERAMNIAEIVSRYPVDDEDFNVVKMLSIRIFNAFAASLKLMFSGYYQNSAMIMRDILETVFLLDYFYSHKGAISIWRFADKKTMREKFSPSAIRIALDQRDGTSSKKREDVYKMFCELAAHPNMHSQHMLRPKKGGDITIGPFVDSSAMYPTLEEMGKLGVQAGEIMNAFLPDRYDLEDSRRSFAHAKKKWLERFYPSILKKA